jgi:hypothetical protein
VPGLSRSEARANEPGGTCSSLLFRAVLLLRPVLRTTAPFFSPARRTQKFANRIDDEALGSDAHQLAPGWSPPARRDLASDTKSPPIFDREAFRAPAHSLHCPSFSLLSIQLPFLSHLVQSFVVRPHSLLIHLLTAIPGLVLVRRALSLALLCDVAQPSHRASARKEMTREDPPICRSLLILFLRSRPARVAARSSSGGTSRRRRGLSAPTTARSISRRSRLAFQSRYCNAPRAPRSRAYVRQGVDRATASTPVRAHEETACAADAIRYYWAWSAGGSECEHGARTCGVHVDKVRGIEWSACFFFLSIFAQSC